ncbi:E3 ubiquitin/ISG15 ligase TRIM25 [Nematolebias whitei]|uniref:E3 ubiquitin/ISG15 ligase TRIM25 n=1 Tax=Nematolebias whitei TaxID=451745 RepID=UPI00189A52C8|nr:E3 ubiquitin/ISG15 ligase TRIM25 [Nematolebias whitei]
MSVTEDKSDISTKAQSQALALELTCPICLQLFSEPASLPCGHIYCFGCLQTMGEGLDQHSCPECQAEYHGAMGLLQDRSAAGESREDGAECKEKEDFNTSPGPAEPLVSVAHTKGSKEKLDMTEPKIKLASLINDLNSKLGWAERVLMKEKELERGVTAANSHLRETVSRLLGQIQDLTQSYAEQVSKMTEEELGPGEAGIHRRVSQASEQVEQLQQAVLRSESLLAEEDETAFTAELQRLKPNIVDLLAEPPKEDEDLVVANVDSTRACSKLENMNSELREQLGEMQRSLRNTLNPSEVTFDPETVHPNLVLSEDLKTVTFSAVKQSYPSSPLRFTSFFQVLSSQIFSEGEHRWEVELEGSPWIIGVCYSGKLARSGLPSALESSQSSWCLMWFNNLLSAFEQGHSTPLKRTTVSRRLEIKLSFKTHNLSFYNISPTSGKTHIYTFNNKLEEPVHVAYRMMSGHPNARVTVYS